MPLDAAPLWEVLQWWGCVLAAASLLPAVLLLCALCAKRKPAAPSGGIELEPQTEQSSAPVAAELQNNDLRSQNPTEAQQTQKGSEKRGDMCMRQLPRIPQQEWKEVRRHSSYTGNSVYDTVSDLRCHWPVAESTVSELRCHWPAPESRKTSACSQLHEEEPFPVYAQIRKAKPGSHRDRDNTDFHLYAKVKKTAVRSVKSEFIP